MDSIIAKSQESSDVQNNLISNLKTNNSIDYGNLHQQFKMYQNLNQELMNKNITFENELNSIQT